jgi:hypothetical protein
MSGETLGQIGDVLASGKSPAQIGRPVFASDMDYVKMIGKERPDQFIGKAIANEDNQSVSNPVNFGSKSDVCQMPDEVRMRLFNLKKLHSNMHIQAQYKTRCANPTKEALMSVPGFKSFESSCKAFGISDWGDWIDTVQARFYFEEYEIPLLLADQFDQLPMTSPIVRVPGALGLLEGQLEADDGSFVAQFNTEASYLVESKNNVVHTLITQDLLDDSSPAIIDKLRREVLKGIGRSYEKALLDGDTTGAHQDSDVVSAKSFKKAFKGLRKLAFENEAVVTGEAICVDHANDTPNKDLFALLLKMLKLHNTEKDDLVYVLGSSVHTDLVTGAIPELFTAFAFGSLASNRTGIVPPVFGVQPVLCQYVREDLNASGVYDGVTTNRTYVLLLKKSRFSRWSRQATKVWVAPSLPSSDSMLMSAKARHSFAGVPQSTSERSVVMAYNIALS